MTEHYPSTSEQAAEPPRPSIDLVGVSDMSCRRARQVIEDHGLDVEQLLLVGEDTVDKLGERPVWIEVNEDTGVALDRWLMAYDAHADAAEIPTVIVVPTDLLDPVSAVVGPHIEVLVAPDAGDRAGALALLAARARGGGRVRDATGGDPEALKKLSGEVQRIAASLARLTEGDLEREQPTPVAPVDEEPSAELDAETVRAVIRARRLRGEYFDPELFHDPAWDMMLDLLAAEIAQHRVPVSSLCMAAAVPPTTALRWMKSLTEKELFVRRSDPHDGRRVFIELSKQASGALRRYFEKLGPRVVV